MFPHVHRQKQSHASPSVVLSAADSPLLNLLEIQILCPSPRLPESETGVGVGRAQLFAFNKHSLRF